jgi:phosphatidylserine/phosphatidylglycerophosphate/cardiolipin synthase-like enzyme
MKLRAYANCDDAVIAWKPDGTIKGCLGFALFRERNGRLECVPTWVGFQGDFSRPGTQRPSTWWPIQKFMWTDYLAQPGDRIRYRVVPMVGTAGHLEQAESLASDWTEEVEISPSAGAGTASYFNRGVVSTQWLARRLKNVPPKEQRAKLAQIIRDPSSKIRAFLAGSVREEILSLLKEANETNGSIYCALYELNDPELIEALKGLGRRANVILANGSAGKSTKDGNREARNVLQGSVTLYNRMVGGGRLAHNKFLVLCDKDDEPRKVWTGSTNWTVTGLCTQANNGILFDNTTLASWFKKQWEQLKQAGDSFPSWLVDADSQEQSMVVGSGKAAVWFTPVREKKDLAHARSLINNARDGILFLMFNPGPKGTLLNDILNMRDASLYIHGVVNQDPGGKQKPLITMYHRGEEVRPNIEVILPEAIEKKLAFWEAELKNYSIAMVHSKVIVVDPFGDHPVVMTGSHNLGPKASSKNDDNLVIIEDIGSLAADYAVNIISIYNQYRWRYHRMIAQKSKAWTGLIPVDAWQDGYFKGAKLREMEFWLGR